MGVCSPVWSPVFVVSCSSGLCYDVGGAWVALGARTPLPVGTEMCVWVGGYLVQIMPREVSLQRGVYIVWEGIPVLWELVCSAVFPYSAWRVCDLRGGRACQVLHICVFPCWCYVAGLSSTCLTINCLHFLFKYAFFPFILVFTLDCYNLWFVFGLFYLCLVTHLLTKHVEISTLCAQYSLL